ncbi:MAG: cytochrome C oxidase subunit III [Deltaproteobacteria bacterium]|nr:MAG: cytochrome C oxidase subunit III [Deltaproteobacteria bacterium]
MSTAVDAGPAHDNQGHPDFLQHHFDNTGQQEGAAKLGMWLFLGTEVLMFSGLFLAYFYMRSRFPEMVLEYHEELNKWMGALNTVFLITSSLTMALAVRCSQLGRHKKAGHMLVLTILFALAFMVVKYFEYKAKIEHGYTPGSTYAAHLDGGMIQQTWFGGPGMFFGLYFVMTGLHGLHVVIGIGLLAWILIKNNKGAFSAQYYTPVENVGLYWHLVDLIWIFLFPLLYLVK